MLGILLKNQLSRKGSREGKSEAFSLYQKDKGKAADKYDPPQPTQSREAIPLRKPFLYWWNYVSTISHAAFWVSEASSKIMDESPELPDWHN